MQVISASPGRGGDVEGLPELAELIPNKGARQRHEPHPSSAVSRGVPLA